MRGERGRVQVRRRPTVSALSGPVSIRRVDHHVFLAPPHRTERAELPHSALGRVSHPGMRRRRISEAPELKHAEFAKHDVIAKALRPARRDLVPPSQKVLRALIDVVIHCPVGHQPGSIAEVVRPPSGPRGQRSADQVEIIARRLAVSYKCRNYLLLLHPYHRTSRCATCDRTMNRRGEHQHPRLHDGGVGRAGFKVRVSSPSNAYTGRWSRHHARSSSRRARSEVCGAGDIRSIAVR